MNIDDARYSKYALVREMMDTPDVVRGFSHEVPEDVIGSIKQAGKLLFTGEGSSRIFPAKNAIRKARTWGIDTEILTEGSRQAMQYDLSKHAVFCASNSGRTKEVVLLAKKLRDAGSKRVYGLTANEKTVLEENTTRAFVLACGWENAVAATKSVVEQALFYQSVVASLAGKPFGKADLEKLGGALREALTLTIPADIVKKATQAATIYFAGYNDGVAEELTLKTNEITRRKSDFLEGTYAVHGIEEVMDRSDIVFVIDPIEEEIQKFSEVLEKGVGLTVVAVADRQTPFPTIRVPSAGDYAPFVYLCAGWNLLVDIGLSIGIDLDKPERARKVGNEITGM